MVSNQGVGGREMKVGDLVKVKAPRTNNERGGAWLVLDYKGLTILAQNIKTAKKGWLRAESFKVVS